MTGSAATTSAASAIATASHFAQTASNVPDTSPTTGAGGTPDHNHYVTIEVDPDQRHDGPHLPFWKGYVLEHEEPTGCVIVAFARALDAGTASRSSLLVRLNEVVLRNGYLMSGAEDLTTGKQIEGMPCSRLSSL
ncbi:MAG: hypothetical protein ABSG62_24005 [Terracidiphilus sp.]|jgi:hypothetical protein